MWSGSCSWPQLSRGKSVAPAPVDLVVSGVNRYEITRSTAPNDLTVRQFSNVVQGQLFAPRAALPSPASHIPDLMREGPSDESAGRTSLITSLVSESVTTTMRAFCTLSHGPVPSYGVIVPCIRITYWSCKIDELGNTGGWPTGMFRPRGWLRSTPGGRHFLEFTGGKPSERVPQAPGPALRPPSFSPMLHCERIPPQEFTGQL